MTDAEQLAADAIALIDGADFGPSLTAPIQRVHDQARQVLAMVREPYKVGIIGEYGAGKTLFVASMLGFLENLPIGDRPTTGNVTRFRLRPVAGGTSTVTGRRIVFLSRSECEACLADLGRQIRAISGPHPGLDTPTRKAVDGDPDFLAAWHRTARSLDPSLDRLVRQLIAVAASARQHDACLGTSREVSAEEFGALIQIAYEDQSPAQPFWIVRQAEIAMDVPVSVLPGLLAHGPVLQPPDRPHLSGFGEGAVLELWDFPGILNHLSSERDRMLTETLLHDVDTAVVLLKAANPDSLASDELTRLLTAVNGGAIAGVGNVFDSPQAVRFREPGLDSDDAVRSSLTSITELLRTAGELAPGEPFLYAGLVALGQVAPELVAGRFDDRVRMQGALAGDAKRVALGLPEGSPFRALLLPVAEDGGRQRVQTMLADQLSVHGLRRRVERVEREDSRLRELLLQLESAVQTAPEPGGAAAAHVEFQSVLSGLRSVLIRLRRSLPGVLTGALSGDGPDRTSFADFVEETAARRVHRWPEWRQTLDSVRGREVQDGPETTTKLVGPFSESCVEAFDTVRAEALSRWERALIRNAEDTLADEEALRSRAKAVFADQPATLTLIVRPEDWQGLLTNASASILEQIPYQAPGPSRYAEAFPLRRDSRFVWSLPAKHTYDASDSDLLHRRHPGYVIRLRHEFVATCAYLMQTDVEMVRGWAEQVTLHFFNRLLQALASARPPEASPADEESRGALLDAIRKLRTRSTGPTSGGLWSELEN
ncbi:hypothetical protein [Dactylosporangium sp. NPDC006015]|uniref:hypothetical protein n=1 Tax=Dactylosporangium sp. NPDC006015 TaxID=3154576 RepID=UPI0033A58AAE